MIKVAHLIHTTGIGGVEAAVDLLARRADLLNYRVLAFEKAPSAAVSADFVGDGVNSLRSVVGILRRLHRFQPDVVVSSLWRSVLIGGIYKGRRPRTPWLVYVHNTRYTHIVDELVHRVALRFADRILCDSQAALDALVPRSLKSRAEVVCPDSELMFLSQNQELFGMAAISAEQSEIGLPKPVLKGASAGKEPPSPTRIIYWGRAVEAKRLDRSLQLMAALEAMAPGEFVFDLISPETPTLRATIAAARVQGVALTWLGPGQADHIRAHAIHASFFLQLSEHEGLAMSVREALALGLVPVVTPVGAISEYTEDGVNSVHVCNDQVAPSPDGSSRTPIAAETFARVARQIVKLTRDPSRLTAMSEAARAVPGSNFIADFEAALITAIQGMATGTRRVAG